ncbi:MAG: hypothetical protein ACK5W8_19245 [Pseudanabaena sp.]
MTIETITKCSLLLGLTHWVDVVGAQPAPQLPQVQKIFGFRKSKVY